MVALREELEGALSWARDREADLPTFLDEEHIGDFKKEVYERHRRLYNAHLSLSKAFPKGISYGDPYCPLHEWE